MAKAPCKVLFAPFRSSPLHCKGGLLLILRFVAVGQLNHFTHAAPEKIPYAIKRYHVSRRCYVCMNEKARC